MSFRIEEKVAVTGMQLECALSSLSDAGATELYPERRITSFYFDTKNTKAFVDSEEGVLPRKKIRIRYYGEDEKNCQEFFLETKISSFEGRYKTVHKLSREHAFQKLADGILDPSLGYMSPVLLVSYKRRYLRYYESRITIDTGITYQKPGLDVRLAETYSVIEIKSLSAEAYSDELPILSTQRVRFSKYCRGMLRFGDRQYSSKRNLFGEFQDS